MKYTVKPGDTLSHIALRHYGNANRWRDIAAYNELENPDEIRVGQILWLPGLSTVQGGDYIYPTNATTVAPNPTPVYSGNVKAAQQSGDEEAWWLERGLEIPITRGVNEPEQAKPPAPAFDLQALLSSPMILAGLVFGGVMALGNFTKPKGRRRR
jgi:hypothetical protein